MTRLYIALFAVAVAVMPAPARAQIEWLNDLDAALRSAQEARRPLLVDVSAVWCPPCKVMEEDVFPDPNVVASSRRFLCVKVDADKRKTPKWYAGALPTIAVLDPWGNVLGMREGFLAAAPLSEILDAVPASFEELVEPMAALAQNRNDIPALQRAGRFYDRARLYLAAREFYQRALKSPSLRDDNDRRDEIRLEIGQLALKLSDFKDAERVFTKAVKECGEKYRPLLLVGLGTAHYRRGDAAAARQTFERVRDQYPDTEACHLAEQNLAKLGRP